MKGTWWVLATELRSSLCRIFRKRRSPLLDPNQQSLLYGIKFRAKSILARKFLLSIIVLAGGDSEWYHSKSGPTIRHYGWSWSLKGYGYQFSVT